MWSISKASEASLLICESGLIFFHCEKIKTTLRPRNQSKMQTLLMKSGLVRLRRHSDKSWSGTPRRRRFLPTSPCPSDVFASKIVRKTLTQCRMPSVVNQLLGLPSTLSVGDSVGRRLTNGVPIPLRFEERQSRPATPA